MEEVNLILEATKFMLLGMGIVFLFLYIMVLVVKIQHFIIFKYFPEKKESQPKGDNSKNLKVMAAISAAITHHNKIKGK